MLDKESDEIQNILYKDRYDFIGVFEDIAIMMNSGLIKKEIVHYMLAYYAIRCWENDLFWKEINRDCVYWRLFKDFVLQMKEIEKLMTKENKFDRSVFTL